MTESDALERVAKAVELRRLELKLTRKDVYSAAGVDPKTFKAVEDASRWPREGSRLKLERALQWPPGTMEAIYEGGTPEVIRPPSRDPGRQPTVALVTGKADLPRYPSAEYDVPPLGHGDKLAQELADLVATLSYLERDAPDNAPVESLRVIVDRDLAEVLPEIVRYLTPAQRGELSRVVLEKLTSQDRNPQLDEHFIKEGATNEDPNPPRSSSRPPTHGTPGDRRAPMKLVPAPAGDDEQGEPLPFEPDLHAARDLDGPTEGELRRQPGDGAGEENQDPGDGWEGA